MKHILLSSFIALGMILGFQNYTEEHQKAELNAQLASIQEQIDSLKAQRFGASQSISALTAKTSLSGSDLFVIVDNASTPTTKKITVANATSTFKTYFDTVYSAIFSNSSGLASLLSDETGSGGGFVRATAPTIDSVILSTSANITAPTFDVAGTDATGDIWYRNSGGLVTRLAAGNTNDYLRISGGLPSWTATSTIFPSQTGKSGSYLATDGTNISWGAAASAADYFSTTTTGTWTKPSLVNASSTVFVECWGGGGGGGGSNTGSGRSGGGGGGAYFSRIFKASDLTSTVSITIGTGGTGGASGNNNGNAGGNTTFGAYLTAYGGGGGGYGAANSGSGGAGGGALGAGGTGNSGTGVTTGGGPGAVTTSGQDGFGGGFGMAFNGSTCGDSAYGGGGGSRSGNGCNSVYGGGAGPSGTSLFGGTGGTPGTANCGVTNPGSAGGNGTVPGGGGGNTCSDGVSSIFAGGNGAGGKCNVITYN